MDTTAFAFTGTYQDKVSLGYPLGHGYRWYLPSLMRFNAPMIGVRSNKEAYIRIAIAERTR